MDTSTSPNPTGLVVNSPSDVSYSSGASHDSTGTTSPATSSQPPSPLVDLRHFITTKIEHASNTSLDPRVKMERNILQSVDIRRDKFVIERGNENSITTNASEFQRPFRQPQAIRTSTSIGFQGPRGLTSNSWRAQLLSESSDCPFESSGSTPAGLASRSTTSFPVDTPIRPEDYAAPMSYPSMASLSDTQLDSCYAYCFDRGNGQYTRLIPADMLPSLQNIPAIQQGCHGMIVLPGLRALPSSSRSSNTEPVTLRASPTTPIDPADNVQSRIDTIVASTPSTPTHHSHHGSNGSSIVNNCQHGNASYISITQHHPHQRRPKIYCDKWVHEGVCAFTQQGCKYKHEMPLDKATQHQLGLFHGLPAWWKKHQSELARERDTPQAMGTEDLIEGASSGAHSSLVMGKGAGAGASDKSDNAFSNAGCNNFGSTMTNALGWKQRSNQEINDNKKSNNNDQAHDGQALGSGKTTVGRVGARGGSSGLSSSVWNPSPFGPIAPPQRTTARAVHAAASPTRSSTVICNNADTNPYASLDALDDNKPEASPNEARLV